MYHRRIRLGLAVEKADRETHRLPEQPEAQRAGEIAPAGAREIVQRVGRRVARVVMDLDRLADGLSRLALAGAVSCI